MRGTFVEAHISDIHFGVMNPKVQYDILNTQFIDKIKDLPLNIISVNGDLFDRKFLANSDVITYANKFIQELFELANYKKATLILIHGTESHDAHQLNLYYHYANNGDVRIVENTSFQYVKGKDILCIPEEYNKGKDYYNSFFSNRDYDACYMHGTYVNSIHGKSLIDLNSDREPVFGIENFWRCRGPIISGHVHVAHCYNSHFYYTGSPIRWCFGEEQPKGFMVLLHNLDTCEYYNHFEEITSFRYDTIDVDELMLSDPNRVITYLNKLKEDGIDYIKIKIKKYSDNIPIIKEYYRNSKWLTVDDKTKIEKSLEASKEILDKYKGLEFLQDPSLDEYTKFVMYVNHYEGEGFVTVEKLKQLLEEK